MDYVCTHIGVVDGHGTKYECRSPITPAPTPGNCHAEFNLPKGSSLRSIDHLHAYISTNPGSAALNNVRVWAMIIGQGNIGHGDAFFISWTLADGRVSKDAIFRACSGPKGPLVLTADVYIDPPSK